jgi:hypothetical protein
LIFAAIDYGEALAPLWRARHRRNGLRRQSRFDQVCNRPNAISDAERHCGSATQAFVHAAEIVMRDIQAHR